MWMHDGALGWGWAVFGMFWMVLFWGVIIGLIVWAVKQFSGDRRGDSVSPETPLEIAQKRLARGEITQEEFEELRATLQLSGEMPVASGRY
jgi:putative membrane protein